MVDQGSAPDRGEYLSCSPPENMCLSLVPWLLLLKLFGLVIVQLNQ